MSLLELLDVLNEQLIKSGELPVEFDSDCREGICGTCGFLVNGVAHGPKRGRTACQQYLRDFKDGEDDHALSPSAPGLSRSSKI
jgi:succinate dehydrogenase / fumarate reductase iron-sulfur subunit